MARARFELVPLTGVDAVLDHLPPDSVVTVTASPRHGLAATLDLAAVVAARGHRVVPHLSARLIAGPGHLDEVAARLETLGVQEIFVVAGDVATPVGPFEGAADLLEALATRGHVFAHVGITGYPEAHAFIPDRTTIEAMGRKAPHATYIVSQICYDAARVRSWLVAVRARGIELPVFVGLPGVVDRVRLLRLSMKVGLGDSVRFLAKQHDVAGRLATGYRPDELVHGLADLLDDPVMRVAGWHLFTFNEVARTDRWRRELLTQTTGARR